MKSTVLPLPFADAKKLSLVLKHRFSFYQQKIISTVKQVLQFGKTVDMEDYEKRKLKIFNLQYPYTGCRHYLYQINTR